MKIRFILALLFLSSCTKQHIKVDEVLYGLTLSPTTVEADGSSSIAVSININKDADASKRKVVLETSAGSFSANGTKTITLDAVYENGLLVARTTIKAPSSPGNVIVTARPENRNPYNDFIIKDSIPATISTPATIKAEASAFSVSTDFISEVQIICTLKNSKNKNVSSGAKVKWEDFYKNGPRVNGRFRAVQLSSDENSKVSCYYSPGHVPVGTDIYVYCTIENTTIKDSVLLSVIP